MNYDDLRARLDLRRATQEFKMIWIVCMDTSHRKKPATTGVFVRWSNGEWHPRASNVPEHELYLDGDAPTDLSQGSIRLEPNHRRRFKLTCPLGCIDLPIRGEKMDTILDDCWAKGEAAGIIQKGGVLSVPLGHVAASVRSA